MKVAFTKLTYSYTIAGILCTSTATYSV